MFARGAAVALVQPQWYRHGLGRALWGWGSASRWPGRLCGVREEWRPSAVRRLRAAGSRPVRGCGL